MKSSKVSTIHGLVKKGLLSFLGVGLFCCSAFADLSDSHLVDLSNDIMQAVFTDIESQKKQIILLNGLNRDHHLKMNEKGVYEMNFQSAGGLETGFYLSFGLTVQNLDAPNFFQENKGFFEIEFPILGLKFSGYQSSGFDLTGFQLKDIVRNHCQVLYDERNGRMPLQLTILPDKETFKIGEVILFSVTLTNVSGHAVTVKDLNEKTLFFIYDDLSWGARQIDLGRTSGVKRIILKPGESIVRHFRATGFDTPKDVKISSTYNMTYKGVKPTDHLTIHIQGE